MPDEYDDRMQDPTSEMAVLACCLRSAIARTTSRDYLVATDFASYVHQQIWETMNRLDAQGMEIDSAAIMAVIRPEQKQSAGRVLVHLLGYPASPDAIATHCSQVRAKAQLRRVYGEAMRTMQMCLNPDVDPLGLAAKTATRFAEIRDVDEAASLESMTVEQVLLEVDPEPDWVIPDFLERGDRFILTGDEGLGKSYLLRQIAIMAAGGLDPFTREPIQPVRAMVIDFENSRRQIRRKLGDVYGHASRGRGAPGEVGILSLPRSDITTDRVLNQIHRELDHHDPEILIIGPLYKMAPVALKTDTEAGPVLAALDTIRDRGIAMLIEAHAGNEAGGKKREWRPRGSSALRGWPEFGYGLKAKSKTSAVLLPWRGDRDARSFPTALMQQNGLWVEERPLMAGDVWGRQDWSGLESAGDED